MRSAGTRSGWRRFAGAVSRPRALGWWRAPLQTACAQSAASLSGFSREEDGMSPAMMGGALAASLCAIAVGSGVIVPIGATVGGFLDIGGIAVAMLCLGLLEGA
jgi:hypothetical protein